MGSMIRTALLLAASSILVGSSNPTHTLTFEDRVRAQEAIERVYYSYHIGATRTFNPGAFYKSHGQFVHCVSQECGALVGGGSVSQAQCDALTSHAAQSNVGRRQRTRTPPTPAAP